MLVVVSGVKLVRIQDGEKDGKSFFFLDLVFLFLPFSFFLFLFRCLLYLRALFSIFLFAQLALQHKIKKKKTESKRCPLKFVRVVAYSWMNIFSGGCCRFVWQNQEGRKKNVFSLSLTRGGSNEGIQVRRTHQGECCREACPMVSIYFTATCSCCFIKSSKIWGRAESLVERAHSRGR